MNYHIIFFDNTEKEITQEKYNQILDSTSTDAVGIEIDGGFYKFSAIQKILDNEEYIEQYPQKQSYNYSQPYSSLKGLGYEGIINKTPNKGLELMAKGLKRFIDNRKKSGLETLNPDNLLEKMRLRYSLKNN